MVVCMATMVDFIHSASTVVDSIHSAPTVVDSNIPL